MSSVVDGAGPKGIGEIVEENRDAFELVANGDDAASKFARRALREADDD